MRGYIGCHLALFAPLLFLTLSANAGRAVAETPRRPEELRLPEITFTPIRANEALLSNGIRVVLHENHDLPLLDLTITFRMGTRFLPAEEHTACGLLGALWRDGGTAALAPDALDEALTAIDAAITAYVGARQGAVNVSLSSEDAGRALPIWRDVVLHPRFDDDRLARARANRLKDLQDTNNNPSAIASRHIRWLTYGRDFPGARLETRTDIEASTSERIRALHARFVRPENAIIGVSGDFQRKEMLALLERLFRDWPVVGPYEAPVAAAWTPRPEPGVHLLRGDYAQSQIRVARLVPELTDDSPDYAAASILSFALGYERIFYRTREEGLSYGTALTLDVGEERAVLNGFGSGRPSATVPLLRAVLEECRRLETAPIEGVDLEAARIFQIGGEVRSNETAADIVRTKVADLLRGRPADFRERHLERLKDATPEDLDRLARAHVTSEAPWVVFVLGNPDEFGVPLDSLGLGAAREVEGVVFGE